MDKINLCIKNTLDIKKLLMFVFVTVMVSGIAVAGVVTIIGDKSIFYLGKSLSLESDIPDSVTGTAGSYYEYQMNITNMANQLNNYTVEMKVNGQGLTLSNGELNLKIMDANGTTLTQSSTVVDNYVSTSYVDMGLDKDSMRQLRVSVEFNSNAQTGTYNYTANVNPGTFTFN